MVDAAAYRAAYARVAGGGSSGASAGATGGGSAGGVGYTVAGYQRARAEAAAQQPSGSDGGGDGAGTDGPVQTPTGATPQTPGDGVDEPSAPSTTEQEADAGDTGDTTDPATVPTGTGATPQTPGGGPGDVDQPSAPSPDPAPDPGVVTTPTGATPQTPGGADQRLDPDDVRTDPDDGMGDPRDQLPIDATNETVAQFERLIQEQTGRDVEQGEDFVIRSTGPDGTGDLYADPTDSFRQEYAQDVLESRRELLEDAGTGASRRAFARAEVAEQRLEDYLETREDLLSDAGTGASRRRFARVEQAAQELEDTMRQLDESVERSVAAQQAAAAGGGMAAAAATADPQVSLDPGEDYTVERTEQGLTAELTADYRQELQRELAATELQQRLTAAGSTVDINPQQDIRINEEGQAVLSEVGQEKIRTDPPEQFGEGGVIPENLERPIRQAAAEYSQTADDLLQPIDEADEGDIVLETAIDDAVRAVGGTEAEAERAARIERRGARTALMLGNLPGVIMGLEEGVETAQFLGGETLAGRAGQVSPEASVEEFEVNPFDRQPETIEVDVGVFDPYQSGDGGEVARFEEAVGALGRRAGEFARERPGEAGAALAGSLVGSAAIMGAASRVSSRAGMAARLAIQPGEELVGYGTHYATRAVAGQRAANIVAPRGELLPMRGEAYLRAGRRAVEGIGSRTRSTASRAGDTAARVRTGIESRAAEARRRSPSVRTEIDPDAGLIDIDPRVREQARRAAIDEPARRIRSGAETIAQTPQTIASAGRAGARRARSGAREAAETAVELPGRATAAPGEVALGYRTARSDILEAGPSPSLSFETGRRAGASVERVGRRADELRYRAGVAAGETVARIEGAAGSIANLPARTVAAPGEFELGYRTARGSELQAGPSPSLSFEAGRRTGATVEQAARRADALGYRAGARVGDTLARIESAPEAVGQRLTLAELRAGDLGLRARSAGAGAIGTLQAAPQIGTAAVGGAASAARETAQAGVRRVGQQTTLATLRAEDASVRARQRASAIAEEFELPSLDFDGDLRELSGRARAAPREFAAGAAVGAGRAGISDVPRFEAFPGQIQFGRAFSAGRTTGAAARGAGAGLVAAGEDISQGVRRGIGRARSVRDLTIRVEPGLPGRPRDTRGAFRMGDPDDLGRLYDELGLDIGRTEGRTGADTGRTDVDAGDEIDVGGAGGQQVAVARSGSARAGETGAGVEFDLGRSGRMPMELEGEAEAPSRAPSPDAGRGQFRTELGIADQVTPWRQRGQVIDPITITEGGAIVGITDRPFIGPRLGITPNTEIGARTGTRTRIDVGTDTRIDTGQETRLRLETEQESEAEAEAEAETETESEFETEFFDDDPDEDAPDRRSPEGMTVGDTGEGDQLFGAGWVQKYAVALAGGGIAARQAPENIEQIAEERGTYLPLPTRGQVDPDEELRENLEAVESFFFRDGRGPGPTANSPGVNVDEFLNVGVDAAEDGGSAGSNPRGNSPETDLELGFGGDGDDWPDLWGESR